jgi:hypothetical protein
MKRWPAFVLATLLTVTGVVVAAPMQGPIRGTVVVPKGELAEEVVVRVRCRSDAGKPLWH